MNVSEELSPSCPGLAEGWTSPCGSSHRPEWHLQAAPLVLCSSEAVEQTHTPSLILTKNILHFKFSSKHYLVFLICALNYKDSWAVLRLYNDKLLQHLVLGRCSIKIYIIYIYISFCQLFLVTYPFLLACLLPLWNFYVSNKPIISVLLEAGSI